MRPALSSDFSLRAEKSSPRIPAVKNDGIAGGGKERSGSDDASLEYAYRSSGTGSIQKAKRLRIDELLAKLPVVLQPLTQVWLSSFQAHSYHEF